MYAYPPPPEAMYQMDSRYYQARSMPCCLRDAYRSPVLPACHHPCVAHAFTPMRVLYVTPCIGPPMRRALDPPPLGAALRSTTWPPRRGTTPTHLPRHARLRLPRDRLGSSGWALAWALASSSSRWGTKSRPCTMLLGSDRVVLTSISRIWNCDCQVQEFMKNPKTPQQMMTEMVRKGGRAWGQTSHGSQLSDDG